ncbi:hypothetical protein Tdes44962_MAKER09301 [Teratosphaeria destructans]|uniref:Secreted protein n=1 Tax=Teratosphaeria destructans TaxID=418781 RepID=A0A9W7SU77_9PEZI|nr:hypothetical protein Tdes44962_MAKER09301 [Teratosphaeria destructans]
MRCAAATRLSLRLAMAYVLAWPSSPWKVTLKTEMPCQLSTQPTGLLACSREVCCSTWISKADPRVSPLLLRARLAWAESTVLWPA